MEYLAVLENRVQEMIEIIKKLKREKQALEIQLELEKKNLQAFHQERGEVKQRMVKILGTLNRLDEGVNHSSMESNAEQATTN